MPPAIAASSRPSRRRSTAVTIAARPDASLWLIVAFGPRSLSSRPARPAAAFPTVLLNSSAGALARTAAEERRQVLRRRSGRRRCTCRARRRRDRRERPRRRSFACAAACCAITRASGPVSSIRRSFIGGIHFDGLESGYARRQHRAASLRLELRVGCDARSSFEQRVAERIGRVAERSRRRRCR